MDSVANSHEGVDTNNNRGADVGVSDLGRSCARVPESSGSRTEKTAYRHLSPTRVGASEMRSWCSDDRSQAANHASDQVVAFYGRVMRCWYLYVLLLAI